MPTPAAVDPPPAPRIAAVPVLKGSILYGATIAFAALWGSFLWRIATAADGKPPDLDGVAVSAAAALAGVLGTAFALAVGVKTPENGTNEKLRLKAEEEGTGPITKGWTRLRGLVSIDPPAVSNSSIPLSFGVWAYAVVAGVVAVIYVLHPDETPESVSALAVVFGAYVVTFITAAYGSLSSS